MTVEEILELMDELLDKSSSVPFSQKKMKIGRAHV